MDGEAPESGQDAPLREKRDQQGAACACLAVYIALLHCLICAWRASG